MVGQVHLPSKCTGGFSCQELDGTICQLLEWSSCSNAQTVTDVRDLLFHRSKSLSMDRNRWKRGDHHAFMSRHKKTSTSSSSSGAHFAHGSMNGHRSTQQKQSENLPWRWLMGRWNRVLPPAENPMERVPLESRSEACWAYWQMTDRLRGETSVVPGFYG